MKLLLTSYGMHTPKIRETLRNLYEKPAENIKIVIITTEAKNEEYLPYFEIEKQQLEETGVKIQNVSIYDLVDGDPLSLNEYDVVYVYGGNVYKYMKLIRERGLLASLRNYVYGGGVYVGLSAGSILACPDFISGFNTGSSNVDVGLTDLSGLGFVDFYVIVHWQRK
ncbi:hypothetical protein FJY84_07840, partial [Candidatus Bathyarchaeota archaeon]|nr:hypothetical protein [Candidatus Bathyarchaeota archaeon]